MKKLRAGSGSMIGELIQGENGNSDLVGEAGPESEQWEGAGSIAEAARKASAFVNREITDYLPVSNENADKTG